MFKIHGVIALLASKIEGAVRRTEVKEVWYATNHMKIGKGSGPSRVAIKLFKAVGGKCLKSLTNIFNDNLFKDKLPEFVSTNF